MIAKEIKTDGKRAFFAAANSSGGFVSFYGEVFGTDAVEKRYLLKGGPGTGKSTFLKRVAAAAEKKGLGVELFKCSSDPDSLDGVIIDGRIAIIDATAPHTMEPVSVGARDEIVDLGAFWDSEGLFSKREEIEQLAAKKALDYETAYSLLATVRSLEKYEELLLQRALDLKKMQRYARNVLKSIPKGNRYSLKTRLFGAIGMAGEVRLDTYSNFAERVYLFSGLDVCGYKLLKMIAEGASERKNSVLISYRPLDPKTPEGLFFEDSGIAFIVGEASACKDTVKRVNMRRFLLDDCGERRAILRRYKELQRMKNELLSAAENAFKEAREHHFELEEIYKKHMDFKALSAFCDGFCERAVKNIK